MEKIDLKDRKILYHLDLDSRQSFSKIGKKVGLHKDAVARRVKKLQEKGIIKGFFSVFDHSKFGYNLYRFYFSFQDVTHDKKEEIVEYFMNEKYVVAVKSLEGNYDLLVGIIVMNFPQANTFWQNTLQKYGKYFSKKVFTGYSHEVSYSYNFLYDEKDINPTRIYQWFDSGKRVKIDDLDYQIIKLISQNARISTVNIAKALDTNSTIVRYRLKKLMDSNIIIAYRLHIDFSKIGFYNYKVDIELNQFDQIDKILKYIQSNPNLKSFIKTIGYVDLEIVILLNNSYQLNQIMEDISRKFPDAVKKYSYNIVIKTYKDYEIPNVGF